MTGEQGMEYDRDPDSAAEPQASRREVLVSRIVDGEASSEDWRELRALALSDQSVWAELGEQQELRRELGEAVERAMALADGAALPMRSSPQPAQRMRLALAGGGWVAAAVAGLALMINASGAGSTVVAPVQSAGMATPITSAAEALATYLELGKQSGEVIGELPTSLVLDRTPRADGKGYEVVYLRQIVEKTYVDDIYSTARGDGGELVVVPKTDPVPDGRSW
jgi:hypothetical protein